MSLEAMLWVLNHSEARHGARLVMLSLAEYANEDGVAYPSVANVARRSRLSERATQEALRRLVDEGELIEDGKSRYGTVRYRLVMGGAESAGGAESRSGGVQNDAQNTSHSAPEPTTNPTTENQQPPTPEDGGEQQTSLIASPISEVWQHYRSVIPNGDRRTLDARRRRCIQRALGVRTVDQCKQAIVALSQSSFHRGDNDRKTSYLDIEYALGKRSDSPDAVIDRWLERSGVTGDVKPWQAKVAALSERDRRRWVEWRKEVRMSLGSDYGPTVENGRKALANIKRVVGIEPIFEGDKIVDWRPC